MQNRIIFKIIATGLNFLMSVIIGILVPRAIGPSAYGDFSYIISTYAFLFQLFMFTSGTAYIYFLSHKKYNNNDVNTFYFLFLFIISILVIIIGLITANSEFGLQYLWNGLDNTYLLYLGLLFGLFTNLQQRLIEFSDSTAQTVQSEKIKLFSRFLIVITIIILIYKDSLDIYSYFILSILNFVIFFILFLRYMSFKFTSISREKILNIFDDFYLYLKPLIIFTLVAAIYAYLGKYVLQASSGSIEQGYYNFAFQLALIPVTFIFSIMTIYMSEMTKKFQDNDIEGVKKIFLNNIYKIYVLHSFITFFIIINAKEIILLTVGDSFMGAIGALQALSIFSLLHTFGLLSGNLFFSSGRNKLYSIINVITMLFGILYLIYALMYFSITSTHLAVFMVIIYFIRVVIQLFINLNFFKINKIKFLFELLLITILVLGVFIIVDYYIVNLFFNLLVSSIILLIINFIFRDYLGLHLLIKKQVSFKNYIVRKGIEK